MTTGIVSWSVAQIYSKRSGLIQRDIHKKERDAFEPQYVCRWYVDEKMSQKRRSLLPGYIFFQTTEEWGDISAIEGVIRVLGQGRRISDTDAHRFDVGSKAGDFDQIERGLEERRYSRRRRRQRPSKRARALMKSANGAVT